MISEGTRRVINIIQTSIHTWKAEDQDAILMAVCRALSSSECAVVPVRFYKDSIDTIKRGGEVKIKGLPEWFKYV
jgi:hypothetical protein